MNPLIQLKTTIMPVLITFVLGCFGLSPAAQAQLPPPPPDGGYPNRNTAEGEDALFNLTSGLWNTAIGFQALTNDTTGSFNTAIGGSALPSNTDGWNNTATGAFALTKNTIGFENTATGVSALQENTTGRDNTATGFAALANSTGTNNIAMGAYAGANLTTGTNNIAMGVFAGANLTTGSNNIDIGALGSHGESNTIRIGRQAIQYNTYIQGISGVAVIGSQVVVNPRGKLGVTISSARFKQDIKPMDKASEAILELKPVTFHYKKEVDPEGILQFGLVAEQVEKINPDLVARDAAGKPYTVRYEAVNAMLLNEFLKDHKAFLEEHRKVEEQEKTIAELKSGMTALAATVKEQAAQIQKVSAQLEASKPALQTVLNNQ
jgi:hypothetical protein